MATGEDALRVLQQIDAKLGILVGLLSMQQTNPVPRAPVNPFNPPQGNGPSYPPAGQGAVPRTASDADLDSQYGDPEVRSKSPRDWSGPSMQGRRFSECPPEYLDLVANRLDYFAGQNDGEPGPEAAKKARWNRLDASRARGWAARIRQGYKPAGREPGSDDGPSDPSPFTDPNLGF